MNTSARRENVPPGMRELRGGDVLHLTRAASPQFVTPIVVRVIRVCDLPSPPPYGWEWIDIYQLGPNGSAVARRELFVMLAGVRLLTEPQGPALTRRRAPIRRTPVRAGG